MRGAIEVKCEVNSDASNLEVSRKFQHYKEFSLVWQILNEENSSTYGKTLLTLEIVKNREAWHEAGNRVTKNWTQLSN